MHGKEQVIAPVLQEALGVKIIVPKGLDTDQFGTFSGEIVRDVDPVEAARRKCEIACQLSNSTLAVASEGSFGPHPTLCFVPADDEILVFLDLENSLEIKVREVSAQTNFAGSLCYSWEDAKKFADRVLFPAHGLILRREKSDTIEIIKGIREWELLENHIKKYITSFGQVFLETDMRAMHNPTRMGIIGLATRKLLTTIERLCPKCSTPGFDVINIIEGLPCSQCGSPTRSTLAFDYECQKCKCREQKKYPAGKTKEDPMYCDWCNP